MERSNAAFQKIPERFYWNMYFLSAFSVTSSRVGNDAFVYWVMAAWSLQRNQRGQWVGCQIISQSTMLPIIPYQKSLKKENLAIFALTPFTKLKKDCQISIASNQEFRGKTFKTFTENPKRAEHQLSASNKQRYWVCTGANHHRYKLKNSFQRITNYLIFRLNYFLWGCTILDFFRYSICWYFTTHLADNQYWYHTYL